MSLPLPSSQTVFSVMIKLRNFEVTNLTRLSLSRLAQLSRSLNVEIDIRIVCGRSWGHGLTLNISISPVFTHNIKVCPSLSCVRSSCTFNIINGRRDYIQNLEENLVVIQEFLNYLPFLMTFKLFNRWLFGLNYLFIDSSKCGKSVIRRSYCMLRFDFKFSLRTFFLISSSRRMNTLQRLESFLVTHMALVLYFLKTVPENVLHLFVRSILMQFQIQLIYFLSLFFVQFSESFVLLLETQKLRLHESLK